MDRSPAAALVRDEAGCSSEQLRIAMMLTQAMYSAAQAREWGVFAELEQQRVGAFALLATLQPASGMRNAETARRMQELLLVNHNILKLAEQERSSIELELRHFHEAKQAQQAYTRNL